MCLCSAIQGWLGAADYLILVVLPSLTLGELLLAKRGPELAVIGALLSVLVGGFLFFLIYTQKKGLGISPGFQDALHSLETYIVLMASQALEVSRSNWSEETIKAAEEIKANPRLVLAELPGFIVSG